MFVLIALIDSLFGIEIYATPYVGHETSEVEHLDTRITVSCGVGQNTDINHVWMSGRGWHGRANDEADTPPDAEFRMPCISDRIFAEHRRASNTSRDQRHQTKLQFKVAAYPEGLTASDARKTLETTKAPLNYDHNLVEWSCTGDTRAASKEIKYTDSSRRWHCTSDSQFSTISRQRRTSRRTLDSLTLDNLCGMLLDCWLDDIIIENYSQCLCLTSIQYQFLEMN